MNTLNALKVVKNALLYLTQSAGSKLGKIYLKHLKFKDNDQSQCVKKTFLLCLSMFYLFSFCINSYVRLGKPKNYLRNKLSNVNTCGNIFFFITDDVYQGIIITCDCMLHKNYLYVNQCMKYIVAMVLEGTKI